jgi:hypothetical protein
MSGQKEIPIYEKQGIYYKDKDCNVKCPDQDTAAILWQFKGSIDRGPFSRGSRISPLVRAGLVVLILASAGMFVAGLMLWPDLMSRLLHPTGSISTVVSATQAEQAMTDQLKNYSERVGDLEKLISVLLGISAIYTITLGLSSWASVQSNFQQAEKWIQAQQSMMKDLKDQAEASAAKVEDLLQRHESSLEGIQDSLTYARVIPGASASLALALQNKYLSDAGLAADTLLGLRAKHPTDRLLNLYLARIYKALGRYPAAISAVTVYIDSKQKAGQDNDLDMADAYYNRGCYRALLWAQKAAQQEVRDQLQKEIAEDIAKFRLIKDEIKKDVGTDTDFDAVRTESWFTKALS